LDDIKLGLSNKLIYNSNCCPGEISENNNSESDSFEGAQKMKIMSSTGENDENKKIKKVAVRKSVATLNNNGINPIVNDYKFNKIKTITPKKYVIEFSSKNINAKNKINSNNDIINYNTDKCIPRSENIKQNTGNMNNGSEASNKNLKLLSLNNEEQNLKFKSSEIKSYLDLDQITGMNQYDLVIFSGDLNYRINMDKEEVKKLIEEKNYEALLEKDQLYCSIKNKEIDLDDFYEGKINFMPTYKFLDGTNDYDYAERVPGWTDRILYRVKNLNHIILCKYSSISDVKTSDHKPVFAIFKVNFNQECNNDNKYKLIEEEGCDIF
jgi:hypothetical protein